MSERRRTKLGDAEDQANQPRPRVELESDAADLPTTKETAEEIFLRRKAEIGEQDHAEFAEYLREKTERDRQTASPPAAKTKVKVNRRNLLKVVAGTAVVGEAAALGYSVVKDRIPAHGLQHAGPAYTEAQRHNIERELINPRADIGGRGFGKWVLLMPTKMGGGTYAVEPQHRPRASPRSGIGPMAITTRSRITCARSRAPIRRTAFECINSTQGGKNA